MSAVPIARFVRKESSNANRTIYYSATDYKIEDETNILRIVGDINIRTRVEEIEFRIASFTILQPTI